MRCAMVCDALQSRVIAVVVMSASSGNDNRWALHSRRMLTTIICALCCGYTLGAIATTTRPVTSAHTLFEGFIQADGAITVFIKGDYVEPYSAIKALLAAHRMGVK